MLHSEHNVTYNNMKNNIQCTFIALTEKYTQETVLLDYFKKNILSELNSSHLN